MAITLLNETDLPKYFWAGAVKTSCHVLSKVSMRPILKKTPYEFWKNRKLNVAYFKVSSCKCYIMKTKNNLHKFE